LVSNLHTTTVTNVSKTCQPPKNRKDAIPPTPEGMGFLAKLS
jgi:hypothetical protein